MNESKSSCRLPVFDVERCSGVQGRLHEIENYLATLTPEQAPTARVQLLELFRQLEGALLKEQEVLDELGRDMFGVEDGWVFGYVLEMMRHAPIISVKNN